MGQLILSLIAGLAMAGDFLSGYGSEQEILELSKAASRDGGTLRIETPGGVLRFEDRLDAGEQTVRNTLVGRFNVAPGRMDFVVLHAHWEGHAYSLVDGSTGRSIRVRGRPIISPDNERYLAASMDVEAGYDPNQLRILRVRDFSEETLVKEVFYPAKLGDYPSGPTDPFWISSTEIFFVRKSLVYKPDRTLEWQRAFMLFEFKDGEWKTPRELK